MNKMILILCSLVATVLSCTPKEVAIEKRIVGRYYVANAHCGMQQDSFMFHNFKGIQFNDDGTGAEIQVSYSKPFEYVINEHNILVCYTTSSNTTIIPFSFDADTLTMIYRTSICSQLNIDYVRD